MNSFSGVTTIRVLRLSLHGRLVGYLVGFRDGRNVLMFVEEFKADDMRPTLSLITHPDFPHSLKLLAEPWTRQQKLHPVLSNLLPEGALRELIAQSLKIHGDNEFDMFAYLGEDLPGALVAQAMDPDDVPEHVLRLYRKAKVNKFEKISREDKFSLAGVQMKFSMQEIEGRYHLSKGDALGDWIVKTPSTRHKAIPVNEFSAMKLASFAGVNIPDITLVELGKLDGLPPINLPDENLAFAIKRFDREGGKRIHMEDFAQVLVKYPHEKYSSANYEQIAKVMYCFSGDGLADVQQFARRLLVNILLANGDAHLKNWSLLYSDGRIPRLTPAYDIVTTNVYIENEKQYALNLGKTKEWYVVTLANFEQWAKRADVPWRAVKPHLEDTLEKARSLWPRALSELPMLSEHKNALRAHWANLQPDFRI